MLKCLGDREEGYGKLAKREGENGLRWTGVVDPGCLECGALSEANLIVLKRLEKAENANLDPPWIAGRATGRGEGVLTLESPYLFS